MSSSKRRALPARKRLVAVLGMHRSGTSAVARGLKVFGVELGERLMPPAPGNNEKGFWEDIDVNALCGDLLRALGRDWDSLEPPSRVELADERLAPLRLRAVELLRDRLREMPVFGLKDPRISVLLPFWRPLFKRAGVAEVSYVLCTRHPLSVARSLERRDGFDVEKSCYLWLQHMSRSVLDTASAARRVVSYDLLMLEPERQLERLAQAFDLPFDPTSDAFAEYARDFLSEQLRHSVHNAEDLEVNRAVPPKISQAHRLLEMLARDEASLDDPEVKAFFTSASAGLEEIRPALAYSSRLDERVARLDREARDVGRKLQQLDAAVAERDGQVRDLTAIVVGKDLDIAKLQHAIVVKDGQIHGLNLTATERDARLADLQSGLAGREAQIRDLTAIAAAGDADIAALRNAFAQREEQITAREGQVQELGGIVVKKDFDIAALQHAIAVKDGQIHGLNLTATERDARLADLQSGLAGREAQIRDLTGIAAAKDAAIAALQKTLAQGQERVAAREGQAQELGRIVVKKDVDIAALQHAIAVKDGQIHGLNLTVAEHNARLDGLRAALDQRGRDLALALDASRNAMGAASQVFRQQLSAETELVEKAARGALATAATSHAARALARAAEAYAGAIRDVSASLDEMSIDKPHEAQFRRPMEAAFAARSQVWRDFADLASDLADSARAAQADTELNRLRLLDSLRDSARARDQLAHLHSRIGDAQRLLARVEAELQERERILSQFGHQFVSRVGKRLDPYPGVRWVITAPLRLIHWILGHARA